MSTPGGCHQCETGGRLDTIYLDYQAATPIDPRVAKVVTAAMSADFANPSSEDHRAGWDARKRVEDARGMIADAIGADSDEIIFTSGATEADNLGVLGAALGAPADRRRILIGATEHKRSVEHTSELQSLMRISYAVICL